MTWTRPKHAQPSTLADFGWSTGVRWGIGAAVVALAVAAAATVGPTSRHAAAAIPPPVVIASTVPLDAASSDASIGALPIVTSSAPASSTVPSSRARVHDEAQASSLASDGIPSTALLAYQGAARRERTIDPTCGLSWPLLAGIGRVESDHGRFAGAILHTDGISTPPVIGIPLNGHGTARIMDSDAGRLDGDKVYDRAVGSMQFIPSTWSNYGVDGNGDGVVDPFNIFDAAAAAADYLCSAGGDLTTLAGQVRAIRAYNNVDSYIRLVLQLEVVYARGVPGLTVPIVPADPTAGVNGHPKVPPANPGPPLGIKHKPKKKKSPAPSSSHPATGSSGGSSSASTSSSASGTPCPTPSDSGSPTGSSSAPPTTTPSPSGTSCPTPTSGAPTSRSGSGSSTGQTDTPSQTQPTSSAPGSSGSSSASGSSGGSSSG